MQRERPGRSPKTIVLLLLFLGCELIAGESASGQILMSIVGQVRTERDQVVGSGVTIQVQTRDGRRIAEETANSHWRFEITNLRRETYQLTVAADGFYHIQQIVNLRNTTGQTVNVRVVLTSRPSVKPTAAELPALTDLSAPHRARKNFNKGLRALHEKRLPEAEKYFEEAVQEYPCYARAETQLAWILNAEGNSARAEAALRKAVQCDPGFTDAYVALGEILNYEKRFAESVAVLQEGLRQFPSAWQFYDQLGVAYYNLGQYPQAEEDWLKVRSLNTAPSLELHAKLAAVYLRRGARNKAYAEMQAYLRAEPDGRFAAKMKDLLKQLMSAGEESPSLERPRPAPKP